MEIIKKTWDVPITSLKNNINNKNVDMQLLAAITLLSKSGFNDGDRFLYDNDFDKKEVAKLIGKTTATVRNKLNKLIGAGIVRSFNVKFNEKVFLIQYAKEGKYYVTIRSDVLEKLVEEGNNHTIKVYIVFKYTLRMRERRISQSFLINQLGLSENAHGKKIISNSINKLIELELIEKISKNYGNRSCCYRLKQ